MSNSIGIPERRSGSINIICATIPSQTNTFAIIIRAGRSWAVLTAAGRPPQAPGFRHGDKVGLDLSR